MPVSMSFLLLYMGQSRGNKDVVGADQTTRSILRIRSTATCTCMHLLKSNFTPVAHNHLSCTEICLKESSSLCLFRRLDLVSYVLRNLTLYSWLQCCTVVISMSVLHNGAPTIKHYQTTRARTSWSNATSDSPCSINFFADLYSRDLGHPERSSRT